MCIIIVYVLLHIILNYVPQVALNFTRNISSSIINYFFKLSYSMEQSSVVTKEFSACNDAACVYNITSESLCSRFQLSNFNISVSATNVVAQGDESQPLSIGNILM